MSARKQEGQSKDRAERVYGMREYITDLQKGNSKSGFKVVGDCGDSR